MKDTVEESMQEAVESALQADREKSLLDVYAGVALGGFIAQGKPTPIAVNEAWYAASLMMQARKREVRG